MKSRILLFLKGMAMGIAEVIPGVSGGTLAFVTGIYEKLLLTIKTLLSTTLIKVLREEGVRQAWEKANGTWLVNLLAGMAAGLIGGVFGISRLMERYPQLLWAFFFGLIIASILFIGKQIKTWSASVILSLLAGAAIAFYITVASPAQGIQAGWFIFLSGFIAISALMLPGISGSFILLLLGMYGFILGSVKGLLSNPDAANFKTVFIFALGALTGLAVFSRILTWTFKNFHFQTLGLLTGFMAGSLNRIWPWRVVTEFRMNSHGVMVPFIEKSVLPAQYEGDPMIAGVIIAALAGFALVYFIDRMGQKQPAAS